VLDARPSFVIHQLTDLPPNLDPGLLAEYIPRNARIRIEGTRNLIAASVAAGARRFVAQSIAWAYAAGPEPHGEDDPLDIAADGLRGVTVRAVAALEASVLGAPDLDGVVLRYGQFYGPGTGRDEPSAAATAPLHVDRAASAALLALVRGRNGAYNVAENERAVSTAKIRREMGWEPSVRLL
jgi:nucleoside-diphosphate-sugar epimerase